jgi:CRISPR-associated protein Cmr2
LRAAFASDAVLGAKATASAGVVIAHCKEDLRNVLGAARAAEKQAKMEGRNRVVLTAMRRSGEHAVAGCTWRYVARVQEMARLFERGATDRWAYQLRAELPMLSGLPPEAFRAELRRLMKRSEGRKEMEELAMDRLAKDSLAEYLAGETRRSGPAAMEGFVILCQTAAFLARKGGER